MKLLRFVAAVVVLVSASGVSLAGVKGKVGSCKPGVFLTVGGKIKNMTNAVDKTYEFTEQELLAMQTSTIETSTAWTAKSAFVGPKLDDLLKKVGASGETVQFVALNDYIADMPSSVSEKYGAILAHTRNDKRLLVRDHGPLFVMLPRDKYPAELNTPLAARWYVWQVCRIDVQ
ncbi:MAG: oxidoreductase [Burkholderiales bacterium]|nr:oxidoreductase [Burkholderiales bacterium]